MIRGAILKQHFHTLLIVIFVMGCQFSNSNNHRIEEGNTQKNVEKKIDFTRIDSIELIYPKKTKGQNAKEGFIIRDTGFINPLKTNLNEGNKLVAECTCDVKLYLFKNGTVFKTIYAALDEKCNYLAYAINSQPVFIPLSPRLQQLLRMNLKF